MVLGIANFWFLSACSAGAEEKTFAQLRKRMVKQQLAARDISDKRVLAAMGAVPRHLFVSSAYRELAYADHPLPIGDGQTISQPYIVALMTQLLDIQTGDKVLEIGTGSGYQAAVLAHLSDFIFSIEIIQELAERASSTLKELGYDQVQIKWSDGHTGWQDESPFDAIIVTCATPEIPYELFAQLNEGGRLVLPLGDPAAYQVLTVVTKIEGEAQTKQISGVRFVPMTNKIK
ncbi:MAG: protein-L-isoaspartate(D-aspartate) O-methyltransferase [Candidatus Aminicenantes bacterium]|nr:protein-L-isoaspartate(D-aspartate) O-methyltransferase [Candidatus Aminicenantes bacterium]